MPQTSINNPLNPSGVGSVNFLLVRASLVCIRTCVPNLGAVRRPCRKKGLLKSISRYLSRSALLKVKTFSLSQSFINKHYSQTTVDLNLCVPTCRNMPITVMNIYIRRVYVHIQSKITSHTRNWPKGSSSRGDKQHRYILLWEIILV